MATRFFPSRFLHQLALAFAQIFHNLTWTSWLDEWKTD